MAVGSGWVGLLEECVEGGGQDRTCGSLGRAAGSWHAELWESGAGGRQDRGMLCGSWGGAVQLGRGTFVRQLGRRE